MNIYEVVEGHAIAQLSSTAYEVYFNRCGRRDTVDICEKLEDAIALLGRMRLAYARGFRDGALEQHQITIASMRKHLEQRRRGE